MNVVDFQRSLSDSSLSQASIQLDLPSMAVAGLPALTGLQRFFTSQFGQLVQSRTTSRVATPAVLPNM